MVDCSYVQSIVVEKIKDYVFFIRNYDQNRNTLVTKLEELSGKKQDISTKVKNGTDKLEKTTKVAEVWLQKVRKLSQHEDLKKLVAREYSIAEKAVKLMEEEDLKKLLKKDNEMQRVVMQVLEKNMMEENGNEDYETTGKVVRDLMKDINEDIKRIILSNMKVAMVVAKLLEPEDLEKISQNDLEMTDAIMRARKECEENLWEINYNDSDVREMLRPLQKLTENKHLMKVLPEDAKLGVEVINGLIKGSDGLKNQITKSYKEDGCYCLAVPFLHYHHQYELSKAAGELAKYIGSLIEKSPKDPVTLPRRNTDLKPIPGVLVKGLDSREELLRTVLQKLQDDQVNAVGLFGMAGTGKTILAKQVKDRRDNCNFNTILMCELSETPKIKHIQDQLAEALDLPLDDVHSVPLRAIKLYNRLKHGQGEGKENKKEEKILIILDNMWQKLNLEEIGIPCESTNDLCCKFLLTSREKSICQMMSVQDANIFHIGLLNESESRKLFYNHIEKTTLDGDYEIIAKRLLNKCGGLPLTIVATANALKGKELSLWRHFADQLEKPILSQVSGMHRETYAILETSYNVMESEEKKMFFLLGCLCPLGSSISIENLMRYAIGLDLFQHVNKLSEALEQAFTWASELISSSMLLEDESEEHVKIHDVVRAFAISLAAKGKRKFLVEEIPRWMCEETFNEYMAISLLSNHNFSRLNGVKARMLQILLLKGDLSSTVELDGCFFQGMESLKVLHLSYMNLEPKLPESMEKLVNLKTLHLEKCKLGDISLICKLIKLVVLCLRDSLLEEFPIEIGKLHNLRILDMDGCMVNLKQSPSNINSITSLSSLEGLYLFGNFKEWTTMEFDSTDIEGESKGVSIVDFHDHELPHLNLLQLHVEHPKHFTYVQFAKKLDLFKIWFGRDSEGLEKVTRQFRRALEFSYTRIAVNNNGLENNSLVEVLLKRAEWLRVIWPLEFGKNLVPELDIEGFRDLKYLELCGCESMNYVISTNGCSDLAAFPNLEYLELRSLENLQMIWEGEAPEGLFKNLRDLKLFSLNKLRHALSVAQKFRNLTNISIGECPLRFIFNENGCVPQEKDAVVDLPCLKSLDFHDMRFFVSLVEPTAKPSTNTDADSEDDLAFFNKKIICPSLEQLELRACHKIYYLWSKELHISSFQNLKDIYIDSCDSLHSLGPPSALLQLQRLVIKNSDNMEDVITRETKEVVYPQNIIKFSQLRDLELQCLINLESFCRGSCKVEFPKLKKLNLHYLPKLTAFVMSEDSPTLFSNKVEFPALEELELTNVIKDTQTQLSSIKNATTLRKLTFDNIAGLRVIPSDISSEISSLRLHNVDMFNKDTFIFATSESSANKSFEGIHSSQLPKLEHLCVIHFPRLRFLFEDEDKGTVAAMLMFCKQLKYLELEILPELKRVALCYFKNLRILHIRRLNWIYVFPSDIVLEMLEDVEIRNCKYIHVIVHDEKKGDGSDGVINFPRLKTLNLFDVGIRRYNSMLDAALHFPSLETVNITSCEELTVFCSGPFLAPKLKEVKLSYCRKLKWFLSGTQSKVVELPSLQSVSIEGGDKMHSFSTRPLKAPNLRKVNISGSKDMQWFLPGYPNHDDVLELPSLEMIRLYEANLRTFTPGPLKASKLTQVQAKIYYKDYSIQDIPNLNDFLHDQYEIWLKERHWR